MVKNRYAEFFEIIADPGRGKTELLINALLSKLRSGDRALIVLPDQSEPAWFPFYRESKPTAKYPFIINNLIDADELEEKFNPNFEGIQLIEFEEKSTFPLLYKYFKAGQLKNLNLVFDDPQYLGSKPEKEMIRILSRKRQYSCDIWSNAHSHDQVPNSFFQYITVYGLGHTSAEIINRKDQLPKSHLTIKKEVDRIANVERGNPKYYFFTFYKKDGTLYC